MMKDIVKVAFALLVVSTLSGCAFGTRTPTLFYPPEPESGLVESAQATESVLPEGKTIILAKFSDERTDKRVVGTMRNAYGMRTADVIPTNDVAEWVTQAVGTELQASGYRVASGSASDPVDSGSILVSGDILNVFCDMYMSFTGQVSLIAKARNEKGELFTKHYTGEGSAGLAVAGTAESFAQSLAIALRDALQKFVADLESHSTVN